MINEYKYGIIVTITFDEPLTESGSWTFKVYEKHPIQEDKTIYLDGLDELIYEGYIFIVASAANPVTSKDLDVTDIIKNKRWNVETEGFGQNILIDGQPVVGGRVNLINKYYVVVLKDLTTITSNEMELFFHNLYPNRNSTMIPIPNDFNYESISTINDYNIPLLAPLIQGNFYPQNYEYPVLLPHLPYRPQTILQ